MPLVGAGKRKHKIKHKMPWQVKNSAEAKRHMAMLRAMRRR